MELWENKVVIVTGASSGIGATLCRDLCKHRLIVVGLARRLDRLEQLQNEIKSAQVDAKIHIRSCDLTSEEDIQSAFEYVLKNFGGVNILINNAGIFHNGTLLGDDNMTGLRRVVETNLMAVLSCTKRAFKSMVDREEPGYIINISSTAGHFVPTLSEPITNIYPGTKHALNALVQVLRHELNYLKKNQIRVTNISPGCVKTEIAVAAGLPLEGFANLPLLEPSDVSDSVLYVLGTNPRVQIQDIIIRPTGETF